MLISHESDTYDNMMSLAVAKTSGLLWSRCIHHRITLYSWLLSIVVKLIYVQVQRPKRHFNKSIWMVSIVLSCKSMSEAKPLIYTTAPRFGEIQTETLVQRRGLQPLLVTIACLESRPDNERIIITQGQENRQAEGNQHDSNLPEIPDHIKPSAGTSESRPACWTNQGSNHGFSIRG